jgi:hypothetical protein
VHVAEHVQERPDRQINEERMAEMRVPIDLVAVSAILRGGTDPSIGLHSFQPQHEWRESEVDLEELEKPRPAGLVTEDVGEFAVRVGTVEACGDDPLAVDRHELLP